MWKPIPFETAVGVRNYVRSITNHECRLIRISWFLNSSPDPGHKNRGRGSCPYYIKPFVGQTVSSKLKVQCRNHATPGEVYDMTMEIPVTQGGSFHLTACNDVFTKSRRNLKHQLYTTMGPIAFRAAAILSELSISDTTQPKHRSGRPRYEKTALARFGCCQAYPRL